MKKLAIVALALVLAMAFVGCGLNSPLIGDWDLKYSSGFSRLSFKADGVVTYVDYPTNDISAPGNDFEGTWVADDAVSSVTIDGENMIGTLKGTWTYAVTEEGLTLTNVETEKVENFTKVADAE